MSSRASLNKVLLIGNLTRDPELRYTPSGAAVCSFGIATNRVYVSSDGSKKEEAEFIRVVAWNKLAELCSQLLTKGRKVYVEGRLQTRNWETPDGQPRQVTEVVIDDMRILDSRRSFEEAAGETAVIPIPEADTQKQLTKEDPKPTKSQKTQLEQTPSKSKKNKNSSSKDKAMTEEETTKSKEDSNVNLDDLPF